MSATIQIQKQKQRWLTFEQICQHWAKKLKSGNLRANLITESKPMDIGSAKFCVVGEAYGWKGDYFHVYGEPLASGHCDECTEYSRRFLDCAWDGINIEPTKEAFVQHWNECHVNKGDDE